MRVGTLVIGEKTEGYFYVQKRRKICISLYFNRPQILSFPTSTNYSIKAAFSDKAKGHLKVVGKLTFKLSLPLKEITATKGTTNLSPITNVL